MNQTRTVFDPAWWGAFLDETENMSKPSVFRGCLTQEETVLMRTYILEILGELARRRTNRFGYRVWVNNSLLETNDMIAIYDSPPLPGDDLESWAVRTFGDKKFGMIVNQCERFNLELSRMMALKLQPLLEKSGIPTEGLIFHLFIGNYDSTPLGIHTDMPGKSVIHFHLGPGSKTMYTWDTKEYLNLVGEAKYNNMDLNKYTPYAARHDFNEGDLYFMPENLYHVGTQEGLSIGLACWCYNRSNYDFANRLQALASELFLRRSDLMLKPDRNDLDDTSDVEKTLALFDIPEECNDMTFKEFLKYIYSDLRYSLHSNAGYRTSPFPKSNDVLFDLEDVVEVEKPFKMQYSISNDGSKLFLYVRGIKLEFNYFSCIRDLVDEINNGNPVKVKNLIDLLDKDWPVDSGLVLLSMIYKLHGIKLLDTKP